MKCLTFDSAKCAAHPALCHATCSQQPKLSLKCPSPQSAKSALSVLNVLETDEISPKVFDYATCHNVQISPKLSELPKTVEIAPCSLPCCSWSASTRWAKQIKSGSTGPLSLGPRDCESYHEFPTRVVFSANGFRFEMFLQHTRVW